MAPSCVSSTVLYTLLSGQVLKTADGNASVNVCVIFLDAVDDEIIRRLRSGDPERWNFFLILHYLLLCRGIKPLVIFQGEKKGILLNDELEKE
jgi:hypothetical protein